jgi:hypothetical protein
MQKMGIRRPLTRRDARFCFQFAVDSALIVQQQKLELPDLFAAQRIKTVGSDTTLYKFENESAIPCVQIPEGQELDGVYCWVPGIEASWQVTWGDVKGYIKSTDVAQVDYE